MASKKVILRRLSSETRISVKVGPLGVRGRSEQPRVIRVDRSSQKRDLKDIFGRWQYAFDWWRKVFDADRELGDWSAPKRCEVFLQETSSIEDLRRSFELPKQIQAKIFIVNGVGWLSSVDLAAVLQVDHGLLVACCGVLIKCHEETGAFTRKELAKLVIPITPGGKKERTFFVMTRDGFIRLCFFCWLAGRHWGLPSSPNWTISLLPSCDAFDAKTATFH